MRNFDSLSEREILALAISLEEEDERVYADFAEGLRENFGASAAVFDGMREEESGHRRRLIELFRQRFGDHIPLIRRQDVKGFVQRKPIWLVRPLGLDVVRKQASTMEVESRRFYESAAARAAGRRHPPVAGRPGAGRTLARESRRKADRRQTHASTSSDEEDRGPPPPLRAADRAARPRRPDGWLGLHAGAGLRRRLRHPAKLGRVPGGAGGLGGRRHQHGLRRGALRRWQPHRPRPPLGARPDLRAHDLARRHRPHAAVPDPRFPRRHGGGDRRGAGGTGRDLPGSATATWTPRRSPPRCRWAWAERWCS